MNEEHYIAWDEMCIVQSHTKYTPNAFKVKVWGMISIKSILQAHSFLDYTCGTVPHDAKGVVVGKIQVGKDSE